MKLQDPKDHPEWKWVIMREGKKRKLDMNVYSDYSDPDLFGKCRGRKNVHIYRASLMIIRHVVRPFFTKLLE